MNTEWCNTGDMLYEINRQIQNYIIDNMETIYAGRDNVGLDSRCGMIYIDAEFIAVDKYKDGTLRYYGGFEYVDKEHCIQMGDFVFYSRESSRVAEHIDRYFGAEVETDDEAA